MRENKHTFAKKGGSGSGAGGGGGVGGSGSGRPAAAAAAAAGGGAGGSAAPRPVKPPIAAVKKDKKLLSFGEDEDEETG